MIQLSRRQGCESDWSRPDLTAIGRTCRLVTSPAVDGIFEQIDAICREFRKQWKKGLSPAIEGFVAGIGSESRPNLLSNLLHLELEYRWRQDEKPTADEYLKRFPDYAEFVRRAFFLSTINSVSSQMGPVADTVVVEAPAAARLGSYELTREFERGGFGVVYEAQYVQTPNARDQIERAQTALEEFESRIAEAVRGEGSIGVTLGPA